MLNRKSENFEKRKKYQEVEALTRNFPRRKKKNGYKILSHRRPRNNSTQWIHKIFWKITQTFFGVGTANWKRRRRKQCKIPSRKCQVFFRSLFFFSPILKVLIFSLFFRFFFHRSLLISLPPSPTVLFETLNEIKSYCLTSGDEF